jgi:hypothetical protein
MFRNTRAKQGPECLGGQGINQSNCRCSKQPGGRPKHGIFNIPPPGPDRILYSQFAVPASFVATEGGVGGARNLERCDGKHGSDGGPCATCRPDPLIAPELAALAPSSWDLVIAANGDPGARIVMVADVSRQLCLCGSSLEALCKTRRNARASRRSVGLFGECPVSGSRTGRSSMVLGPAKHSNANYANRRRRPELNYLSWAFNSGPKCQAQQGFAQFAPCLLSSPMAPSDSLTTASLVA